MSFNTASVGRWHLAQIARDECGLKREEEDAFIDFLHHNEKDLGKNGTLEERAQKAVDAFRKRAES